MGFLQNIFKRSQIVNPPLYPEVVYNNTDALASHLTTTNSGLYLSAHWACVSHIAKTIASLPAHVYQRTSSGIIRVPNHPAEWLLHMEPNPDILPFSFRESMQANASNTGVAYAEIIRDIKQRPVELWPLAHGDVTESQYENGQLYYTFTRSGNTKLSNNILKIPGLTLDGINCLSPIAYARTIFKIGLSQDEFARRFFTNGTHMGGFFTHPGQLSNEAVSRLSVDLDNKYTGLINAHKTAVLEEGMKFEPLVMPLEDLQFLESRKFTILEIARLHGVPPHIIGDLERATFSNIEEQSIEYVQNCIRPWVIKWEQAINARLFSANERRQGYYIKFEIDSLLRGNFKARAEAYAIMIDKGIYSIDEVREKEDMNKLTENRGTGYHMALNMGTLGPGGVLNQNGVTNG